MARRGFRWRAAEGGWLMPWRDASWLGAGAAGEGVCSPQRVGKPVRSGHVRDYRRGLAQRDSGGGDEERPA